MKRALVQRLLAARAEKRPAALVTDLGDGQQTLVEGGSARGSFGLTEAQISLVEDAIRGDRSGLIEGERLFVQVVNPPLRMVVVGAVHIAQALAPMASLAGYDVTIIDPRRAWASNDRFPGITLCRDWPDEAMRALAPDRRTAIVTLTHDPKLDDPALDEALRSEAFYIGSLGSARTQAARLERLRRSGFGAEALARIHGPIGLAIGAKSPAEIAVAILAEVTQVRRGAPGAAPSAAVT